MAQPAHLVSALRDEIRQRNVNACAGILRRLISESPNASSTLRAHRGVVSSAIDLGVESIGEGTPQGSLSTPTTTTLSIMANVSAAVERWKDALTFVDTKRKGPICSPSPVFLAKLMTQSNVTPVAEWCDDRGVRFCVPTAIARIGALSGAWDVALRLALRYESKGEQYSTGVLIPMLANGGQPDLALGVFRDAVSRGNMVDLALIENILHTTASCGHWAVALAMLKDMDRYFVTCELADSPLMSDVYQTILNACPSWETSLEVLEMVKRTTLRPPTEKMIAAVLSTADRCGHVETATQLFDYARDHGIIQRLPESSKELLVRNFRATAQWERALEALQWMDRASEASVKEGLVTAIDLYGQSGQWEAALKAADEIMASGHGGIPPHTYLAVLNACVTGRQASKALSFYATLLEDVGVTPPPMALCLVLRACIEAGMLDDALEAYRKAEAMGPAMVIPPSAQRLAMMAAVKAGKWEESLLLVNSMNASGLPYDAQVQRYGLWAAALTGSWRTSLAIYNKLPPSMVTRRDRELVRLSAHTAGPVAQAIVKQLSGVTGLGKK